LLRFRHYGCAIAALFDLLTLAKLLRCRHRKGSIFATDARAAAL
jgi:hypothetical protein